MVKQSKQLPLDKGRERRVRLWTDLGDRGDLPKATAIVVCGRPPCFRDIDFEMSSCVIYVSRHVWFQYIMRRKKYGDTRA